MKIKHGRVLLLTVFVCVSLAQNCAGADGTGLAPGVYMVGTDGKFHAVTNVNVAALWPGVWKEDTNGLRAQLYFETDAGQKRVHVGVGSVVFNSLGGYVGSPNGKFSKFELQDSNGIVVPFVKGMALESQLPSRISIKDLPRWPNGGLKDHIGFFTNGGPFTLKDVNLDDLYRIKNEGNYTLTVCLTIYKFGTNAKYLNRVDLPCVTTKIRLKPPN